MHSLAIHASHNFRCNLRISLERRRDMDIIEMTTLNTRSDMTAVTNMETSWEKRVYVYLYLFSNNIN